MPKKIIYNDSIEKFEKVDFCQDDLGPESVRVKPYYVGICGSDLNKIQHKAQVLAIGHEWSGIVKEIGESVKDISIGDIVTSPAHVSCGECEYCLNRDNLKCIRPKLLGTDQNLLASSCHFNMRDLITLSKDTQKKIDHKMENIALYEVAFIGDCAFEKAVKLGSRASDRVLIFGAGGVGFFTAASFKERGYDPIVVEVSSERREFASKYFKSLSFAEVIMSKDHLGQYDLVIDCTGDVYGPGAIAQVPFFCKIDSNVVIVGKYNKGILKENLWADRSLKVSWVANHKAQSFRESIEFWRDRIEGYTRDFIKEFSSDNINEAFESAFSRKYQKCMLRIDIED